MQPLIDNARLFGQRPEALDRHTASRSPQVLRIAGSDSRVPPALVKGVRSGELFAPRDTRVGKRAVIEYAGQALGISHVVVAEFVRHHILTPLEWLRAYAGIEQGLDAVRAQPHGRYCGVPTASPRKSRAESNTSETLQWGW
ncbi:hypothetical protein ACFZCT_15890 [Streptomyces qaidamensis]|jgi:carbonic anhydrase|uniref:hypothetical protein n=1 Tax=Streptomyces qaidamensis TaxID=1783515 RepID=UPI0036E018D0